MTFKRAKVPIKLQHTSTECGAACLAMILAAHGHHTTVRAVADGLDVGRDGVTALSLVRAARRYGLTTRAFSIGAAALPQIPTPAIAYWRARHFVVVEDGRPGRIRIVDPGDGRQRMTDEEFAESFSGVVFAFEPGPGFRRGRFDDGHGRWWRQFARTAFGHRRGLVASLLLVSLVLQAFGLILPFLTELLVDRVVLARETGLVTALGLGVAAAFGAYAVVGLLRMTALVTLRVGADVDLMRSTGTRLLAAPYRFFALRGSADLANRIMGTVLIREILTSQALLALLDVPLAVGYLLMVTVRSPLIGGCLLAFALVQIGLLVATGRRVNALAHREASVRSDVQGHLIEAIRGIESVKASGSEPRVQHRWGKLLATHMAHASRSGRAQGMQQVALGALRFAAPLTLVWVGALQVVDGDLTLGAMLALQALAAAALAPLGSLVDGLHALQGARPHVERLADIWRVEPEAAPADPVTVSPRGGVRLDDVGFRYTSAGNWIVRGVTVEVAPGQKVALVGRSGSGKSTLARLLLGLLPPSEGEIHYDGVPASRFDPGALRRQFGVVPQEPVLFSGTIAENIALNAPDASMEEIVAAATLACVHEEIAAMPMGYHTVLVEGGGLSGGQRQRVALARALLARPKILLLDEATSHLDTATEAAIEAALTGLDQTRVVIAHRLSTVRDADLILVMDGGRIVEAGSHGELLAAQGYYARLARAQDVLATDPG
ncbi:cyclolysin T1SS permease/ATPase CyaB [Streptosporangium fragile]|uniref:Cyclolysin T1SS permease/ATPase CyaB n=1 Tax=Streptosporangium fragile TaxID=46186 RepID=A0ABN3VXD4_9ACTN